MLNADSLKSLCNVDENGRADTAAVNSINGILNNLTRITQDTQSRTQTASSIQSDPNSATSKVSQQSLDFIAELGASTSFYLINDNLDNDGDGCINEEIYGDSTDNDGDSLKEEDGRIGTPATKVRVPGNVAMVSPTELSLKYVFDPVNNKLLVVPRIPDDLTWGNSEGLLTPYLGLRWVRWDEHAPSHNDTIFARVVQNETGGAFTPETVKDSPDYEKIRTLAIIEIRKKVLAQTDAKKRIQLGKLTVGGCWDAL